MLNILDIIQNYPYHKLHTPIINANAIEFADFRIIMKDEY